MAYVMVCLEITSPPIGRDTSHKNHLAGATTPGLEITSPPIGRDTTDYIKVKCLDSNVLKLPPHR